MFRAALADKSKQIGVDDRIVAVAQGKDGEFQNVVGWRIENAIALIRGTKGTIVRLEMLPKGASVSAKPKIVEMVREKIILKDESAKKEIKTYISNGKTIKIGIISVPAFYIDFNDYKSGNPNYKSTTHDVKLLLDSLKQQGVDGIVMDMRQNGGGSLMEAIELTGLFIKTGPVVQVRDSKDQVEQDKDGRSIYRLLRSAGGCLLIVSARRLPRYSRAPYRIMAAASSLAHKPMVKARYKTL